MSAGLPDPPALDASSPLGSEQDGPGDGRVESIGAEVTRHVRRIGHNGLIFSLLTAIALLVIVALAVDGMGRQQRQADQTRLQMLELQADLGALGLAVGQMRIREREVLAGVGQPVRAAAALGRWNESVDRALGLIDHMADTSGPSSRVASTLVDERQAITDYARGAAAILHGVAEGEVAQLRDAELALVTLAPLMREVEQATVRTQREVGALGVELGRQEHLDTRAALLRLLAVTAVLLVLLVVFGIALRRRTHRSVAALGELSFTDPLTGLLSRAGLRERAGAQGDPPANRAAALFYFDLDHFGLVNDVSGHEAGDALLAEVGESLGLVLGRRDLLARVGGDEFAVYAVRPNRDELAALAQRLLVRVRQLGFRASDCTFPLSASLGVAYRPPGRGFAEVMRAAAQACRGAKSAGGDGLTVAEVGDVDAGNVRVLMTQAGRLHGIMEGGSLRLARQPIINLHGERDRCELLVRAIDPGSGETISPASIIPAAETFGLITTLDRWTVCASLLCIEAGLLDHYEQVGINLSSRSIKNAEFIAFLEQRMRDNPAAAKRLSVEVRESAAVALTARMDEFVERVHACGGQVAIDDFGSGAASFGLLHAVRFDTMKITGSIVRGMGEDPSDLELMRAFVNVARTHRMSTVGCMLERPADIGTLRRLGVDFAQGFGVAGVEEIDGGELWALAASLATDNHHDAPFGGVTL